MASEKQKEVMEQTILLVNMFLETNESDIELSRKTGISSSTVGRRLTNKEVIKKCFSEKGERLYEVIKEKRKNNLQRGKIIGNQISILNNLQLIDNNPKLRLDVLYKDYPSQIKFLSHIALTFRTNLDTLSNLFNISKKELENEIMKSNESCYESFYYLFYKDHTNQELAKARLIDYYRDLINAILKKDIETVNVLIREIKDTKIKEFKEVHKFRDIKTDEEIMTLLNYQLKYSLSNNVMADKFHFDRTTYAQRVRKLIDDNPELKSRYEDLIKYYSMREESKDAHGRV